MDIETKESGRVLILKPMTNEINSGNAHLFKNGIVDFIVNDYVKLAIDLSNVEFVDSSGLSALLSTLKTISRKGKMVLFGISSNVSKLFSITKLDKGIFEIYPDQDKALEAFIEKDRL